MRKALIWLAIAGLLLTALPTLTVAEDERLSAVGFNIHGFYRVRYDNFFALSWASSERGDDSDHWSWIDQRMILQPTLIVADPIQIYMELDLLGNVMYGNNELDTQPVVVTQRKPNDLETIDTVTYDELRIRTSDIFNDSMSNTGLDGAEVDPINIRQLFMRVALPFGSLRIGRQGVNWGMGLFMNSGTPYLRYMEPLGSINDRNAGFDSDGGDVYDRVLFMTKVAGFYMPSLSYDRLAEYNFKTGDYDIHCMTFANQFRNITFSDSGTFDSGFRLGYAGFTWELEGLGLQGKAKFIDRAAVRDLEEDGLPTGERAGTINMDAYIGAGRFKYDSGRWAVGAEAGFSSPADSDPDNEFNPVGAAAIEQARQQAATDPQNASKTIDFVNAVVSNQAAFGRSINTFAFDPNYNVDLIMWDRLMGGSFENGAYFKVNGYIRPLDGMHIGLDVINSYINEAGLDKNGTSASHDLGWEVDVNFAQTMYKHFTADLEFGYMIPGMWFRDNYRDVSNVYTLQLRTIVDF